MKKLLVFVTVIALLLPNSVIIAGKFVNLDDTVRFLVEFKSPSLSEYTRGNRSLHMERLKDIHNRFKSWIKTRFGRGRISVEFFNVLNGVVIEISPKFVDIIKELPYVDRVTPDVKVKALLKDSVPLIRANYVWGLRDKLNRTITGKNVTIALIDTGVDYTHPDIAGSYAGGYDFVNNDPYPLDDNGHGTHCAGILVGSGNASNGTYVGVAPDARLYVYKVLDNNGNGSISNIIAAIEKAVDPNGDGNVSDHMDIISLSLGIGGIEGNPDDPICRAVDNAVCEGVVVVTAAGNDGYDFSCHRAVRHTIVSPGCARKVITVGASTHLEGSYPSGGPDHVALYSGKGPSYLMTVKPDVVAPGGDVNFYLEETNPHVYDHGITSTRARLSSIGKPLNLYYTKLSGTSMAAPHVAGAVALLLQKHPDWDPFDIKAAIRYTAKDIGYPLTDQGFGRLDALKLVNLTTPPPVALFYDAIYETDKVILKGIAKSRYFLDYKLYCRYVGKSNPDKFDYSDGWILLCECDEQIADVVNGGTIYEWNTSELKDGWYLVKLVVTDNMGRKSEDFIFVNVNNKEIFVNVPYSVGEGERFTVSINDRYGNPVNALVIMNAPFRVPKIRYGSEVEFKAYDVRIRKNIVAGIWAIAFLPGEITIKRVPIVIENQNIH
ncbi:MAG TPA: hypothetical protein ENG74_00735 [Thermoplasmatales archaeon]|nr:hypothetical protein [Thermoplasmatales archaeon]